MTSRRAGQTGSAVFSFGTFAYAGQVYALILAGAANTGLMAWIKAAVWDEAGNEVMNKMKNSSADINTGSLMLQAQDGSVLPLFAGWLARLERMADV